MIIAIITFNIITWLWWCCCKEARILLLSPVMPSQFHQSYRAFNSNEWTHCQDSIKGHHSLVPEIAAIAAALIRKIEENPQIQMHLRIFLCWLMMTRPWWCQWCSYNNNHHHHHNKNKRIYVKYSICHNVLDE